jgi:hypothetical protein
MSDFNSDLDMLTEYTQWVATRKLPAQDTSPDEFMRDRIKQTAVDRISDAVAYYDTLDPSNITFELMTLHDILEGVYIAPEDTDLEGEMLDREE